MVNNILENYSLGENNRSERVLQLENDKLIFEIKLFRRSMREQIFKKYPLISETEILKKLNTEQAKLFKEKQKKLIREFLSASFLKDRSEIF